LEICQVLPMKLQPFLSKAFIVLTELWQQNLTLELTFTNIWFSFNKPTLHISFWLTVKLGYDDLPIIINIFESLLGFQYFAHLFSQ
jgi:hypothetical protein